MTRSRRTWRFKDSSAGRQCGEGDGPILHGRRLIPVFLLFAATAPSAQLAIPAPPTRRINDYAGALAPADRDRLEQKLIEHERTSSNQVVVGIFPSLRGENLEDYSIRLAQAWRIGQKGLDNGVIFLVFLEERKMRLEVGYGLEATLTDAIAGSIIRDVVAPRFRQGKLAEGIDAGLDAIGKAIAGTYVAASPSRRGPRTPEYVLPLAPFLLFGVVVAALFVYGAVNARRTRRRGWTGGRDGWVLVDPRPWRTSGSGWSGGGSGSSSDSFSGGGGSFGGGGASGEW